jgi:hypothetical protein
MKLFILTNNLQTERIIKIIKGALEIIKSGLDMNFDWDFEFVNEELDYKKYNSWSGERTGLNMYHTNRWTSEATGCQAIIYFYKPDRKVSNIAYTKDGKSHCQIAMLGTDNEISAVVAHELTHCLFRNLAVKGYNLEDDLDSKTEILKKELSYYDALKLGVQAELEKLDGYEDILNQPMPMDSIVDKMKAIIESGKKLLAMIAGMRFLNDLVKYMSEMEGFTIDGSRAQRNNNPLNLAYMGQSLASGRDDKNLPIGAPPQGFCIFKTIEDGWNACRNDIIFKIKGLSITGLSGESTIEEFIKKWTETSQEHYIKYICSNLKVGRDFKIKNFII